MLERDNGQPLSGFIELDDSYLGGERTGSKRGRGAQGKTYMIRPVLQEKNNRGHKGKVAAIYPVS